MRGGLRSKLTYANVMATIAVFIALGGASYAAIRLPKSSVGTKQLKKDAVISSKVKAGSLRASDFGAGQLPAGQPGPAGPKGAVGPTQGFVGTEFTQAFPPAAAEDLEMKKTISLNSGGTLFVFGRGDISVNCSGTSVAALGLYVDGAPATASGLQMTANVAAKEVSIWGLSNPVSAGQHVVSLGEDCVGGTWTGGSTGGDTVVGAILTGS